MSFLDHLDELRRRILYSVYSLLAAAVIAFAFVDRVLVEITMPMIEGITNQRLLSTEALDPIMLYFKAGLLLALFIASPLILLQVWFFIAPGLYSKEKRMAVPFVFFSTALFLSGAYFGHKVAFPITWQFLGAMVPSFLDWHPTASSALSLYMRILLGLGLVFQMPMIVFVLARFGLITAKFMIKHFRYAILIIFIVAAVASPGQDPASQLVFAAPMTLLYLVSIGVAWLFGKKKAPAEADAE